MFVLEASDASATFLRYPINQATGVEERNWITRFVEKTSFMSGGVEEKEASKYFRRHFSQTDLCRRLSTSSFPTFLSFHKNRTKVCLFEETIVELCEWISVLLALKEFSLKRATQIPANDSLIAKHLKSLSTSETFSFSPLREARTLLLKENFHVLFGLYDEETFILNERRRERAKKRNGFICK